MIVQANERRLEWPDAGVVERQQRASLLETLGTELQKMEQDAEDLLRGNGRFWPLTKEPARISAALNLLAVSRRNPSFPGARLMVLLRWGSADAWVNPLVPLLLLDQPMDGVEYDRCSGKAAWRLLEAPGADAGPSPGTGAGWGGTSPLRVGVPAEVEDLVVRERAPAVRPPGQEVDASLLGAPRAGAAEGAA